jgi:MOSC domain-containing protein YiiM
MQLPTLISIQVGFPAQHGSTGAADPMDRPWKTGFYKSPVTGPLRLRTTNLEGDGQADLVNHGGPDKAVCCYPMAHYPGWRTELSLEELPFGAFGENFTIAGLTESDICIGDIFRIGAALVQISQPRQPCWKLARRWRIKDLTLRVQQSGRTGWYFRVLSEGIVQPGDPFELVERTSPEWTIDRANVLMHHDKSNYADSARLAAVESLSTSWKRTLSKRVEDGVKPDMGKRLGQANET